MKRLEEHHAEFIASAWKYDPPGGKLHHLKKIIKHSHCFGVFTVSEQSSHPIAWILRYSSGYLGHLFVSEKYRRRGLGKLLTWNMCAQIIQDGGVPLVDVEKDNPTASALFQDIGFVELGNPITLTVACKHKPVNTH